MTAWHDQPPRTRRQVRMNERGASVDAPFNAVQTQTDVSPFDGFPHDASAAADPSAPESQPRFDTSQMTDASAAPGTPALTGRRAQRAADATQSLPTDADQSWRPRDLRPRDASREPSIQRGVAADGRGQSFSTTGIEPEGSAAAAASAPVWPLQEPPAFMPPEAPRPASLPQAESEPVPAPEGAAFEAEPSAPVGRPLTRRELRALEAARNPQPEADGPAQVLLFEAPVAEAVPLAEPEAPQSPAPLWLPEGVTMPAPEPEDAPVIPQPLYGMAAPTGSPVDLSTLPGLPLPLAPQAVRPARQGSESDRGVDSAPQFFTAPIGHWATREAIDGVNQLTDSAPGRVVTTASGPVTSNALVLPAIPQGADMSVPFATTGEVLITGTINLPPSYGTTGAHPARYDHSDLDAIIDAVDRDDVEIDSAPVRAIRAVSTHTSPRDVIAATKPSSGNRLPIILAITAGAMMVSVAVLFVAGLIFNIF